MVGKTFEVAYDDFSGGHFVGAVGTHQPMNTFVGNDVQADPTDGSLMPSPAFFAATSAIGGDAPSTTTRPLAFTAGATSGFMWAGGTHAYTATYTQPMAPPLAVTASAVGLPSAAKVLSSPAYFPPQNRIEILCANGTTLCHIDTALNITTTGLPATIREIIVWGEFVFANTGQGKLYFCNPSDSTIWTATDWIGIPVTDASPLLADTLNTMVVHQGNLWITTPVGWIVVRGIPNSTLAVTKATTVAAGHFPVSIDTSIVSTGEPSTRLSNQDQPPLGPLFRELVGVRDRPLNYGIGNSAKRPGVMAGMTRVGNYIVAHDQGGAAGTDEGGAAFPAVVTFWVLDARTGVWMRRQTPVPAATPVLGVSLQSTADLAVYRGTTPDVLNIAWLGQPGLFVNQGGAYQTATAELCEYYRHGPFTVKEVLCEVDYGRANVTDPTSGQDRSIAVAVRTTGVPIESGQDLSLARAQSSTITHILPSFGQAGANYTNRRSWVRVNPTDGNDTMSATPIVTLTGCKLRRLILKCVTVD